MRVVWGDEGDCRRRMVVEASIGRYLGGLWFMMVWVVGSGVWLVLVV